MSWAIWITGIPGHGKSALARAAIDELKAHGHLARILELAEIRQALTPDPRHTDAEREIVYRAICWMATLMVEAHVPVIIDATAHPRSWLDHARSLIPRFAEVQIVCPPHVAKERERILPAVPCGINEAEGGSGGPAVEMAYAAAAPPELVIDSTREPMSKAARRIAALGIGLAASTEAAPPRHPGWAIWLTGRPGSGKTAVASLVRQALAAGDVPLRVLDLAEVRRLLPRAQLVSAHEIEIMHLSLAYAAKLLTESGVAVIVDATASRRAWRSTARALIPCFAEIQLICPESICVERHRSWRWRLDTWPSPPGPDTRRDAEGDMAGDYEESLRPDLTLRTDLYNAWNCAQQVLFLVQRLASLARKSASIARPR